MHKLKKGDLVKVVCGKSKGSMGTILRVLPKLNLLLVSGVNLKVKHIKPSKESEGKIVTQEGFIHISNVAYCTKEGSISKIGFIMKDGKKSRMRKKDGEVIV